jgi:hypothetical protein
VIEYTIEGDHRSGEREELFYRSLGDCEKRAVKFRRNEPLAPCKCHRSPCLICQLIFLSTLGLVIKTMPDNRKRNSLYDRHRTHLRFACPQATGRLNCLRIKLKVAHPSLGFSQSVGETR